jgi:WD40 repeat protein
MDHPNIAHVFDGGETASGRPYFVMELVRGVPITDFCDQNRLGVRERLELFVSVCQAVQHAHQKGIIHRDLKPTNVLVTLHDDKAVVKVIDFGIAKATGQQLTEKTLFTNFAQLVGTPLYMSPEQAQLSGLDVDTRSDIYSLGVLLYELLTGTTPFDQERLRTVGFDEIRRIIREEEPARPSTRLSTLAQAATLVAARRKSDPKRLCQLVRGELDWIVMKCLEKDRNRRYETANSLAEDVQRYLRDEPVEACPPSAGYKLRKLARKYRKALATATAFVLVLILGVIVTTWLAVRAMQAEADARGAEVKEKAAADQAREALGQERRARYFYGMALADREWQLNNVAKVEQILDDCPLEPRHWEWRYFKRLCHLEQLTLPNNFYVESVAFSPDGQRLAATGPNGTVKVWDALGGKQILSFYSGAARVAFSPDGRRLVTAAADAKSVVGRARKTCLWDAQTGQQLLAFDGFTIQTSTQAFSPDGRRLAGAKGDKVKVWDTATGRELFALSGHKSLVTSVAFSPDGKHLASASADQTVKVWNTTTRELVRTLSGHGKTVTLVTFSGDSQRLASASLLDGTVKVWQVTTGANSLTLQAGKWVYGVAFSPDGRRLAMTGGDRQVKVCDAGTGQVLFTLHGHTDKAFGVAFSPDGRRLASASRDKTVKVWDRLTGQEVHTLRGHTHYVTGLAFSPAGDRLASASGDKSIKIWKVVTGQEVRTLHGHTAGVISVAYSPDGRYLASSGYDGMVKVWDALTGRELLSRGGQNRTWGWLAFSRDSRYLAAAGVLVQLGASGLQTPNTQVAIWDTTTGQEVLALGGSLPGVRGLAFTPNGQHLTLVFEDGKLKVVDRATGREAHAVRGVVRGGSGAFSPDGQRRATWAWPYQGGTGAEVKLWDAATGQQALNLSTGCGVSWVAFSPDGQSLAAACQDGTVRVWQAAP